MLGPVTTTALDPILRGVSRSIYLTLKVAPGCLRSQLGVAYLFCRAADTIADTRLLSRENRLESLHIFRGQFERESPSLDEIRSLGSRTGKAQRIPEEQALLRRLEECFEAYGRFCADDQVLVRKLVTTLTRGMEMYLTRFPAEESGKTAALESDAELDLYTYHVAGCVGEFWTDLEVAHRPLPVGLRIQRFLADRLVFRRIRARVGGRLKYFLSGGAPLSADIAKFFYAAGLPILEGYGLTETSPVITVNTLSHLRFGTVGRPIPGVEVKIAPDGEILTRGPHVMKGYFGLPAETAEAIDHEGWFHTGDIGEVDADGYVKITDRKKDLIATAGGKKIAPQPIEGLLRQNPFIANAVLLGDRRKFPIALLAPMFPVLEAWAADEGLTWTTRDELIGLDRTVRHLEAEAMKHLRELARFEVPKRFLIVAREFSIESGELTPKLSVRRRVVEAHYRDAIEAVYGAAEAEGQSEG